MRYDGGEFGLDRVADILSHADITTAEQLCSEILNSVEAGKNRRLQNDITAMVLLRAASEKAHA
jgi:serine phosphatase RsbU (regulator of sigma subunit)